MKLYQLLLLVVPASVISCSTYDYYLCNNEDGSFNETATADVCKVAGSFLQTFDDERHYCFCGDSCVFDNCNFRDICKHKGALGPSNCWAKDKS
ncbi:hypothetical protein Slin14017_G100970 [Septoria linicola]|nr:hypothetical protein Slin14017_G100970 [Septoria linicola]